MNLTALLNFKKFQSDEGLRDTDQNYYFVADSLKAVIDEFFISVTSSIVIIYSCRRNSTFYFIERVMQLLLSVMSHTNVQLVHIDHTNPERSIGPGLYNLLLVDCFEAFLDIDIVYFSQNDTNHKYYHIFLMQRDQYVQQDMKSIFGYCWRNGITACNIQRQDANGEIFLYTYFPFSINNCNNIEPQHIDTFIGKSWANKTYFPKKLKNFYGCPLVAFVRNAPPYVFLDKQEDGTVSIYGLEIDILKYLEKGLNFTLSFRYNIMSDRSKAHNESLEMVGNGTADLAFGFYRRRPDCDERFSTTFPHIQVDIVAVIYLPGYYLSTFEILLYPFEDYVWYALSLTVVILFAITRLVQINRAQSISLTSMVAIALGEPIEQSSKLTPVLYIFITWLWATFIIRQVYSEYLFHLLRYSVYSFIPETVVQALDEHFYAVMNHFMYKDVESVSLFNNSLNSTSILLPNDSSVVALSYIEEESHIRNLFAVTNSKSFAYFVKMHNNQELFYVIPETIMRQHLCFYMIKHSYLINQFDWEIIFIRSSGLLKLWSAKYFDEHYYVKEQMYQDEFFVQQDFIGLYVVCIVLYFISFVVFLMEIFSRKIKLFARLFG